MKNFRTRMAISLMVVSTVLIGCEASSTDTQVQSTIIDFDIVVDGDQSNANLEVFLTVRATGDLTKPLALKMGDQLLLLQAESTKALTPRDSDNRYETTVSPLTLDQLNLQYSRESGTEITESVIQIPFIFSDFDVSVSSENTLISNWQISLADSPVNQTVLPVRTELVSKPISCTDNSGARITIESGVTQTYTTILDSQLTDGENTSPVEALVSSQAYLRDQLNYSGCEFSLQMSASWRNNWDGIDSPIGIDGPVWVWPASTYSNEILSGTGRESFDIQVLSNSTIVSIEF